MSPQAAQPARAALAPWSETAEGAAPARRVGAAPAWDRGGAVGAPGRAAPVRAGARGGRGGWGRESSQDVRFCAGSGFHCEAWELRVASPDLQGRESRGLGGGPSGRKVPWRALGEALRVRAGVGVGDLQRVQGCWHPPLSPIPRTWGGPEIAEGLESQALPDLVSTAGL